MKNNNKEKKRKRKKRKEKNEENKKSKKKKRYFYFLKVLQNSFLFQCCYLLFIICYLFGLFVWLYLLLLLFTPFRAKMCLASTEIVKKKRRKMNLAQNTLDEMG